jgi:hypothetical protein
MAGRQFVLGDHGLQLLVESGDLLLGYAQFPLNGGCKPRKVLL